MTFLLLNLYYKKSDKKTILSETLSEAPTGKL